MRDAEIVTIRTYGVILYISLQTDSAFDNSIVAIVLHYFDTYYRQLQYGCQIRCMHYPRCALRYRHTRVYLPLKPAYLYWSPQLHLQSRSKSVHGNH